MGNHPHLSRVRVHCGGHCTDAVYSYTHSRTKRGVFAIKGEGAEGYPGIGAKTYVKRRAGRALLVHLGVSALKGDLFAHLKINTPGPGFCHWPLDTKNNNRGYDEVYFKGLVSERMVVKRLRGRDVISWEVKDSHTRNEPLDARVYAYAALGLTSQAFYSRKRTLARLRGEQVVKKRVEPVAKPVEQAANEAAVKPKRQVTARRCFWPRARSW